MASNERTCQNTNTNNNSHDNVLSCRITCRPNNVRSRRREISAVAERPGLKVSASRSNGVGVLLGQRVNGQQPLLHNSMGWRQKTFRPGLNRTGRDEKFLPSCQMGILSVQMRCQARHKILEQTTATRCNPSHEPTSNHPPMLISPF